MKPALRSPSRPARLPVNPHFSSGPTSKRPGWNTSSLGDACLGRSHRSSPGKKKLKHCLDLMRGLLGLPDDYHIGIVPASDTGAVEMAMWSLLGERGVDIFAWEAFGKSWLTDAVSQLKLTDLRVFEAEYGQLPDLHQYDNSRDCIFTWNGTAAGVRVPDASWISPQREGLVIADSTSAVFAMEMPFDRLDVVTFSWQKALGGEGGHGVIILSPRAVERLENFTPPWPLPKIFRLTKKGAFASAVFDGDTINTPSMLCVEDAIDALEWAVEIGGRRALFDRVDRNLAVVRDWLNGHPDFAFLADDPATISPTSITIRVTADWFLAEDEATRKSLIKTMGKKLEDEGAGFDITAYRDAPVGLRLWGGPTVEADDLKALLPWIDWAFAAIANDHFKT